jgi:hypothetical protein
MNVNPVVVGELRDMFRAGATPSALIRHIAARHAGEPHLDAVVRAYFREAFGVPMLRVGSEQVRDIAAGGSLPTLNATVLPRMIQNRTEWDALGGECWLDAIPVAPAPVAPESIPELAGSWERLDDEAKRFVRRLLDTARALHENGSVLAALAEQLQARAADPDVRRRTA